jgi:hypothetical protein
VKLNPYRTVWLGLALFAACSVTGCGASSAQRPNVSGTITNFDGKKVNGVSIVLKYAKYEREAPVKDGTFFLSDVDPATVAVYFKTTPRPAGPPLPPNATAEEKQQYQQTYGGNSAPPTRNIAARYFQPGTGLQLEIRTAGPHRFDLRLEKK